MRIIQCESKEMAIRTVAGMVIEKIESHPDAVIGLATGKTMEPVYAEIVKEVTSQNLEKCFSSCLMNIWGYLMVMFLVLSIISKRMS